MLLDRDPFQQNYSVSCSEQTALLLEQIQVWHFKGLMKQIDQQYQQIWLASDNQWLAITDNVVPNVLFPWSVQSLLNDKIMWQADLPDYCHNTVSWTMSFNE
ncbi:hypothetical protein A9G24_07775 [Gilliamella sp. App6-5]|jgi:hypothetical protein|uniref:hypothetical protein n=1 Tax=Gilliamella sp. App6-5 TaxID=3120232 RepID=UPI00080EAFF1|nr:hypothetical protein [Gilliamella apicola]OCG13312.1 hypothetical protein A9G24_07775 [Gilliamella apicola]